MSISIVTKGIATGVSASILTRGLVLVGVVVPPTPRRGDIGYSLKIEEAPSFGLSFDSYIGKIYKNTFIKMKKDIDVDFVQ